MPRWLLENEGMDSLSSLSPGGEGVLAGKAAACTWLPLKSSAPAPSCSSTACPGTQGCREQRLAHESRCNRPEDCWAGEKHMEKTA